MAITSLSSAAIAVDDVISETLFGGDSQSGRDASRIPMVFTSTRRLRLISEDFNVNTLSEAGTEFDTSQLREFATNDTVQHELSAIQMAINPNSISWKQPKRITKRDTQEGSIFFHFTNSKGQNNDILTMDFRGNTGNLDRVGDLSTTIGGGGILGATGQSTGSKDKLLIWHNLWNLTREQILLDDNTINEFLITYTSPAIPVEIMLIGFFSNVLEWTDVAEKPNSKDYSFSFTVQKIVPDIDDIAKEIQTLIADLPIAT